MAGIGEKIIGITIIRKKFRFCCIDFLKSRKLIFFLKYEIYCIKKSKNEFNIFIEN